MNAGSEERGLHRGLKLWLACAVQRSMGSHTRVAVEPKWGLFRSGHDGGLLCRRLVGGGGGEGERRSTKAKSLRVACWYLWPQICYGSTFPPDDNPAWLLGTYISDCVCRACGELLLEICNSASQSRDLCCRRLANYLVECGECGAGLSAGARRCR